MNYIISAIISLAFTQAAFASSYRGLKLQQIDCLGSNGVQYKITESPSGSPLQIDTSLGVAHKTFFGNSFVTATNELNILMGTDKSGYISEYQMVLPLSAVEVEKQGTTGVAYAISYGALVPIGTVTCSVQYSKGE